jgi:integrase
MKLTKKEIDRIERPVSGQVFHWDDELKGFGIRVTPTGISYVARGSVRGSARRPRITLGRHGPLTPDMARTEAKKALADMARGIDRRREEQVTRLASVTLEQAYLAYVQSKPLADKTRRDYDRAMRCAAAPWRKLPLLKVTGGMVSKRFDEVSADGPAQANQMFRFLRALFGWAMWKFAHDDGTPLIPANPCDILSKLKRWNRVARRERHVEAEQLARFMEALQHTPQDCEQRLAVKDLCAVLILTGLREQEGCGLLWEDVDLEKQVLRVRHTKNHRDHVLPIGSWLTARLLARRERGGSLKFVFPADNRSGHLMHHRKHVLAIVQASGVEFRLHDLRRTFASIVNHHLERSLSAYTIKRLMNHSSGNDVTAGYIQHPVETLRQPMEMVEAFVLRCAGIQPSGAITALLKAA